MILVGIDDRPTAADGLVLGRWLAAARSAELLPVWVHPYARLPSLLGDEPEELVVRDAVEAMAEDVRATLPPELRSEMRLLSGRSAADGLAKLAAREQASLIVLGASERAGIGRLLPGATARRLLSGSPVPVAIAPRGYASEPGGRPTIGVGFDGSAEGGRALDWAAALSADIGGHLRLCAVHRPVDFGSALAAESAGRKLRRLLRDRAERAAAGIDGVPEVETALADGDPAAELIAASAEVDLLVLGSRGYGPVRSVLLGSVSEAVLAGSTKPVVVVPRGEEPAID